MFLCAKPAEFSFERPGARRVLPARAQPSKLSPDLRGFGLDGGFTVYQGGPRGVFFSPITRLAFGT